jgi:hypothetical protein
VNWNLKAVDQKAVCNGSGCTVTYLTVGIQWSLIMGKSLSSACKVKGAAHKVYAQRLQEAHANEKPCVGQCGKLTTESSQQMASRQGSWLGVLTMLRPPLPEKSRCLSTSLRTLW